MEVDSQSTATTENTQEETSSSMDVDSEQEESKQENMDDEKKSEPAATAFSIVPRSALRRFKAKWNKQEYVVLGDDTTTIGDLKEQLQEATGVRIVKQKIVGFKRVPPDNSTPIDDMTMLREIKCKKNKFVLVGTLDKDVFIAQNISSDILDDLEWSPSSSSLVHDETLRENRAKLENAILMTEINLIVAPRRGKKLLVLDIDYTLFDMGGRKNSDWNSLKRPYTDYLLTQCYREYDIVMWSQTSWKWIEIKLTEMNMIMNASYNITFVLDKKCMFKIKSRTKKGELKEHHVKPLELIWRKFPDYYNENNTIHIDDLGRNFAMNPSCGMKISAFKNARENQHDTTLLEMTQYLLLIAQRDNFVGLDHSRWRDFLRGTQEQMMF